VRIVAERELLAPPEDVWALLAEPYHLSDWWPGYASVHADRRGVAEGARWQVARSRAAGLLRRPGGEGMVVLTAIEPLRRLGWRDLQQGFAAEIQLAATDGRTLAALTLEAAWWRLDLEGLRRAPRQALARLHALCQTAASL